MPGIEFKLAEPTHCAITPALGPIFEWYALIFVTVKKYSSD